MPHDKINKTSYVKQKAVKFRLHYSNKTFNMFQDKQI